MEPGESSLAIMMETNVINLADIIILTGVSGVGKSTFAARLAKDLGASLIEGDDYHSPASISRMARGLPLADDDRWPWLEAVAVASNAVVGSTGAGRVVISCSALKRSYRDHLVTRCVTPPFFVQLHAPRAVIADRLAKRTGHFFQASLLDSQFDDLELSDHDERHCRVDAAGDVETVYAAIRQAFSDRKQP